MGSIIQIIGSLLAILLLCLPFPVYCQVTVYPVIVSPLQPVVNGYATLACQATGFDPEMHTFTWQRSVNSTFVDVTADDRVNISHVSLVSELVKLYEQNLTINNLKKSDAILYLCVIRDGANIVANGEGLLTVNSTEEFPVCFPEGPAVVNEGDTLSCRTVIDGRTPQVSDTNTPQTRPDWVHSSLVEGESGLQLEKNVTIQDEGVTFLCFSLTLKNANWTQLSCTIGPLVVIPSKPSTTLNPPAIVSTEGPLLSITAIVGISIAAFVLLFFILILVICCSCKPKRRLGAKSYLLNFGDFFSGTIRRAKPMELGRETPDGSDEPFPNEPASDDQTMFSLEDDGDENGLPVPKGDPNIYVEHSTPGTSTRREAEADVYWNDDLTHQLADAMASEDDFSD